MCACACVAFAISSECRSMCVALVAGAGRRCTYTVCTYLPTDRQVGLCVCRQAQGTRQGIPTADGGAYLAWSVGKGAVGLFSNQLLLIMLNEPTRALPAIYHTSAPRLPPPSPYLYFPCVRLHRTMPCHGTPRVRVLECPPLGRPSLIKLVLVNKVARATPD